MRNLPKVVTGSLAAMMMTTWGISAQADNHGEGAKGVPVEFWSCSFRDGKDMGDLDKAIDGYNAWAGKNDNSQVAWVMTPVFYGPENTIDVAWLGVWPDGNAWGKFQDAFDASAGKVLDGFMEVVTCNAHEMATSLAINAPEEPPQDGMVLFSRCTVAEGKTPDEAVGAHRQLSAKMGGKTGANSWLFFPGSGSSQQGSAYQYWQVLGFDNHTELGAAWEMYTNGGGWKTATSTLSEATRCGDTTTWRARRVTK